MSGLFGSLSSGALPTFLQSPQAVPAPIPAPALTPSVAPMMTGETWATAQSAELLRLQQDLQQLQLELERLLTSLAALPQTPQTPVAPPSRPGLLNTAWQFFSNLLTRPAPSPAPGPSPSPAPQPGTSQPAPTRPTKHGKTEFVLSSFNVLSSSAGKSKGYASGTSRIHSVAKILKANNVSVVGFQEMAADQLKEFRKIAGDQYKVVAGDSGKRGYHDTAIAWKKNEWDLVKSGSITVPSYAGIDSKVPFVRLKNKQTGQEAYFIDAHNPANTKKYHNQDRFRNEAARLEAALANRLIKETGLPVFVVGDMNSVKEAQQIFTSGAPLKAANPKGKAGIDWIFGSKDVHFSDFRRERGERGGLLSRTTDHPVVFADVRIGGK